MNLRDLNIIPDLLKLIAEVDEFKGSWKLLRRLSPERRRSLRHVATITIGSFKRQARRSHREKPLGASAARRGDTRVPRSS